jgi:hypothetical protein
LRDNLDEDLFINPSCPAEVPDIHEFSVVPQAKTWMAGPFPAEAMVA